MATAERFTAKIGEEWTLAGHVDLGSFSRIFDLATDHFRDGLALGSGYAAEHARGLFVVEAHFTYRGQVCAGDVVAVNSRLLDYDWKKLHLFHEMENLSSATSVATGELLILNVDLSEGRSHPFDEATLARLAARLKDQPKAPGLAVAGRAIRGPTGRTSPSRGQSGSPRP